MRWFANLENQLCPRTMMIRRVKLLGLILTLGQTVACLLYITHLNMPWWVNDIATLVRG